MEDDNFQREIFRKFSQSWILVKMMQLEKTRAYMASIIISRHPIIFDEEPRSPSQTSMHSENGIKNNFFKED